MKTRIALLTSAVSLAFLSGCAATQTSSANAPVCVWNNLSKKNFCTSNPAPSAAAEQDAQRLTPAADALTVYVVRDSWGEGGHVLKISVNGASAVDLLPTTMLRLRLKPGTHQLSFEFNGKRESVSISGQAGGLSMVAIEGIDAVWAKEHRWVANQDDALKRKVGGLRLSGDHRL